uniref:Uncharacterized protein n=1 Tax=Amphidinium carterae TaxID=2961 RepID=A7YXG2_AMPCA|nr:unknown [Amphidinium carterae]
MVAPHPSDKSPALCTCHITMVRSLEGAVTTAIPLPLHEDCAVPLFLLRFHQHSGRRLYALQECTPSTGVPGCELLRDASPKS